MQSWPFPVKKNIQLFFYPFVDKRSTTEWSCWGPDSCWKFLNLNNLVLTFPNHPHLSRSPFSSASLTLSLSVNKWPPLRGGRPSHYSPNKITLKSWHGGMVVLLVVRCNVCTGLEFSFFLLLFQGLG